MSNRLKAASKGALRTKAVLAKRNGDGTPKTYALYQITCHFNMMAAYAGITGQTNPKKRIFEHLRGKGRKTDPHKHPIAADFKQSGDLKRFNERGGRKKPLKYFSWEIKDLKYNDIFLGCAAELALIEQLRKEKFYLYNRDFSGGHEDLDAVPGYRQGFNALACIISNDQFTPRPDELAALEKLLPKIKKYVTQKGSKDPYLNESFYMLIEARFRRAQAQIIQGQKNQITRLHEAIDRLSAADLIEPAAA